MMLFVRQFLTSLALVYAAIPTESFACNFYAAPQMCDPIVKNSDFWIGEWQGFERFFRMELDGQPFSPPRDTHGKLTLFNQDGRLGFSGGGMFSGDAELSTQQGSHIDPLDRKWAWVEDVETLDAMLLFGNYNLEVPGSDRFRCGYKSWPRWYGTFKTPDGLEVELTLMGVNPAIMVGRVFYDGPFRDLNVLLDVRFMIMRDSFDYAQWRKYESPDSGEICRRCNSETRGDRPMGCCVEGGLYMHGDETEESVQIDEDSTTFSEAFVDRIATANPSIGITENCAP